MTIEYPRLAKAAVLSSQGSPSSPKSVDNGEMMHESKCTPNTTEFSPNGKLEKC